LLFLFLNSIKIGAITNSERAFSLAEEARISSNPNFNVSFNQLLDSIGKISVNKSEFCSSKLNTSLTFTSEK
jgi:hypothetical protein